VLPFTAKSNIRSNTFLFFQDSIHTRNILLNTSGLESQAFSADFAEDYENQQNSTLSSEYAKHMIYKNKR